MYACEECGFSYDLDRAERAAGAIREGIAEVVAILERPGVDLWSRREPTVWSPLEYGCHLRDVMLVQRERVLAVRRTERPVFPPMGRDERVEHDGYAEQHPADVVRQLTDAALMFTTVLDRLGAADWERVIVYPYPEPTEHPLRWVAVHTVHEVRHHLLDIRRQLT
jgi:DinB family protein